MFSRKWQAVYQRLLILGLLSMCLFYFGYSDAVESVYAAPCVQECENTQFSCNDDCQSSCLQTSSQTNCNNCVVGCRNSFHSCMRNAVWCDNEVSQPGRCTVNYGLNCPYDPVTGQYNCNTQQGATYGYSQTCTNIGGGSCVACPDYRYCTGTGGNPQPCV